MAEVIDLGEFGDGFRSATVPARAHPSWRSTAHPANGSPVP